MIKKYNNLLVTGDLHLGDVVFDFERELIDIIKSEKFDGIVFGGDTFDTWRSKRSIKTIIARYHLLFKALQRLDSDIIFIKGNHDPKIDVLKSYGFEVMNNCSYVNANDQQVKIIHGHEFDRAVKHARFVWKQLAFVEEMINRLIKQVDKDSHIRLRSLLGKKSELKQFIKNFYKVILGYSDMDILLFGHTHVPLDGEENDLKFYNWGAWTKDYGFKPSYIIDSPTEIGNYYVE